MDPSLCRFVLAFGFASTSVSRQPFLAFDGKSGCGAQGEGLKGQRFCTESWGFGRLFQDSRLVDSGKVSGDFLRGGLRHEGRNAMLGIPSPFLLTAKHSFEPGMDPGYRRHDQAQHVKGFGSPATCVIQPLEAFGIVQQLDPKSYGGWTKSCMTLYT